MFEFALGSVIIIVSITSYAWHRRVERRASTLGQRIGWSQAFQVVRAKHPELSAELYDLEYDSPKAHTQSAAR